MNDLEPKKHKIEAYNQIEVGLFKEISDRNNDLAALAKQEEETRIKLINLKKSIHELRKGDKIKISDILVPMGGFYRFLKISEKDEFIKHHMDIYKNIENQYLGVVGQRVHREDEFGECNMRLLRSLFYKVKECYSFTDKELIDKITEVKVPQGIMRDKTSLDNTIKTILGEQH